MSLFNGGFRVPGSAGGRNFEGILSTLSSDTPGNEKLLALNELCELLSLSGGRSLPLVSGSCVGFP
jgi:hypothetical protein